MNTPRWTAKAYFDAYDLATRQFSDLCPLGKTIDQFVFESWYPKFQAEFD